MTRGLIRAFALAAALFSTGIASAQAPGTASPPAARPTATAPAAPATKLLDINSASKGELDALPGIGPVRSEAIIKGRPYKGKDELTRRKILPQNVYDGIKDRIIARQA